MVKRCGFFDEHNISFSVELIAWPKFEKLEKRLYTVF